MYLSKARRFESCSELESEIVDSSLGNTKPGISGPYFNTVVTGSGAVS